MSFAETMAAASGGRGFPLCAALIFCRVALLTVWFSLASRIFSFVSSLRVLPLFHGDLPLRDSETPSLYFGFVHLFFIDSLAFLRASSEAGTPLFQAFRGFLAGVLLEAFSIEWC